ncbi:MAG: DUF5615 family PIN-like protein [Planctomycetota bacterium]
MIFLADANTGPRIMAVIREAGHQVVSAKTLPPGKDDVEVLRDAAAAEQVVVTADTDFGSLVFLHQFDTHGVVLLRIRLPDEDDRAAVLQRSWQEVEENLPGNFVTVTEAGIRVRPVR